MTKDTSRLATALGDRYRIERELGQGGMATVYLAHDLKHDRPVALKVLRRDLSHELSAERFDREIKLAARLTHPHILPLFDSGEADGFLYYVMPVMEGESLRDRLEKARQLAVDEVVQIAREVADALDYAHRQGTVHRDIKPENIMMHEGHALVADFGIGKAVTAAAPSEASLTQTGVTVGTPAYMSPEQAAGDQLDGRSDLFSLGCMLFEMLTGEQPFVGETVAAVIAKRFAHTPPPVTKTRSAVPMNLSQAVARLLERAPEERVASGAALIDLLDSAPRAAATRRSQAKSVVVLPFANRSPDPDNEYFVDGLTDEIIADLSRLQSLKVISRNSAMTLKGTNKDTRTIARELGVTHVVTGSVRRAGDALRVTAELVDAREDTSIWSEKYSGTLEDVFGIQEEVATKIVAALQVQFSEDERPGTAERPIVDPVAYDCYLRARQEMYGWTPDAMARALRLIDDAIAIVGDSPLLLATKAQVEWSRVNTHQVAQDDGLARSSELVEQALAIDPEFPLAVFVRGLVAGLRGQPEAALPDLYRARELWPSDANVLAETCRFSNASGLRNQGVYVRHLVEIDPLTPVTPFVVSTYHVLGGRWGETLPAVRRAIELAPGASMLHVIGAWQIAECGERREASDLLERTAAGLEGPYRSWALFSKHALDGNVDEALGHATAEMEQAMSRMEFSAREVAHGYMLVGRTEDALRFLRQAVDLGFINYPSLTQHDPFLEPLRGDPAFQALMGEVKPRWEAVLEWEAGLSG